MVTFLRKKALYDKIAPTTQMRWTVRCKKKGCLIPFFGSMDGSLRTGMIYFDAFLQSPVIDSSFLEKWR